MKKRILSGILAVIMMMAVALPSLAEGYSIEESAWFSEVANREDPGVGDEVLDMIWLGWNDNGILPKDDTIMMQIIEKRFNVNITNVPVDNYNKEQLNLMYSTATDYDISTLNSNFREMAELESIRPVDIEMIKTYAPTIVAQLEAALGEDWMAYCEYNGEYWGIPTITASWTTPQIMGLRTDWLKNIGYDETNLPTTLEGLEEMLLKLHTDDPDGNGVQDTYALGVSNGYGYYEYAYYGIAKGYWYYDEDGTLMTAAADPALKDALKLLARWYKLGIYDPEVLTDKRADGVAKFVAGKIAGYESLDNCFQVWGGATLSGPGALYKDTGIVAPCTIIPPVDGQKTVQYNTAASAAGVTFGYNCTDEKMIRGLQILDAYFRDLDLWLTDNAGEKDVDWYLDEACNLVKVNAEAWYRHGEGMFGQQRYYNFNYIPGSVLAWRLGGVGQEHSRYEIWNAVKDFPMIPNAPESVFKTDADLEYSESANKVYDEYVIKAIMGEVDIDATFDDYMAQWLAAGGQEILDAKRELAGQ